MAKAKTIKAWAIVRRGGVVADAGRYQPTKARLRWYDTTNPHNAPHARVSLTGMAPSEARDGREEAKEQAMSKKMTAGQKLARWYDRWISNDQNREFIDGYLASRIDRAIASAVRKASRQGKLDNSRSKP